MAVWICIHAIDFVLILTERESEVVSGFIWEELYVGMKNVVDSRPKNILLVFVLLD